MGAKFSRQKDLDLVPSYYILGLKSSGKTTVIEKLEKRRVQKKSSAKNSFPPEFFNNPEEEPNWYIHGRDSRRVFYGYVARKALLGLIFVFDSADVERIDQAVQQLKQFLHVTYDEEGTVVMILANKQDADGAMSPEDIEAKVKEGCDNMYDNSLFVMPCSTTKGQSLMVAYDYFLEQSKLKKEGKLPLGLIPSAWKDIDWETAHQDKEFDELKNGSTIVHKMKKSALKNPFKAFKDALFC